MTSSAQDSISPEHHHSHEQYFVGVSHGQMPQNVCRNVPKSYKEKRELRMLLVEPPSGWKPPGWKPPRLEPPGGNPLGWNPRVENTLVENHPMENQPPPPRNHAENR